MTITEHRAKALGHLRKWADKSADLLHVDLARHGFQRVMGAPWRIRHPSRGVEVLLGPTGYRITFPSPEAEKGLGLIDMPADSAHGVVAHVAVALAYSRAD